MALRSRLKHGHQTIRSDPRDLPGAALRTHRQANPRDPGREHCRRHPARVAGLGAEAHYPDLCGAAGRTAGRAQSRRPCGRCPGARRQAVGRLTDVAGSAHRVRPAHHPRRTARRRDRDDDGARGSVPSGRPRPCRVCRVGFRLLSMARRRRGDHRPPPRPLPPRGHPCLLPDRGGLPRRRHARQNERCATPVRDTASRPLLHPARGRAARPHGGEPQEDRVPLQGRSPLLELPRQRGRQECGLELRHAFPRRRADPRTAELLQ